MATLYTHQDTNIRKTWFLMTLFVVIIIAIGWVFSQAYGDPSILYIAVIFSFVMNILSYWFSDKLVLSLAGAKPITREENKELWNIVENLSITAGLPMPKLYIISDSSPNAFATGRNKEHATVAVTTGLLQILDRTELEGVISHELSHIGNQDILISTIVVMLVGFITLLSDIFLRTGFRGRRNNSSGPIVIVGIVLAILSPLVAILIKLAISRKREFLADASGALLSRYPEGLASALLKISQYSQPMLRANDATAHLFIANPFGPEKSMNFMHKLFMTHPPVEERIKSLRER